jgi:hypothetical protein
MSHDVRSDLVDPGHAYNAPEQSVHDEMLAALRAAEEVLSMRSVALRFGRPAQTTLRIVQAAILKAEARS